MGKTIVIIIQFVILIVAVYQNASYLGRIEAGDMIIAATDTENQRLITELAACLGSISYEQP